MKEHEQPNSSIKIAVVGDVHDLWETADEEALKQLGVDLVLLVGDFGNEAVEIVKMIAQMDLPKAVILGNHDAWYTASDWGKKQCPYDRTQEDRVQQQLDVLGTAHVGYGKLDLPELRLTVVGGRPFSWGGSTWKNEAFYQSRFGVSSLEESTTKIAAVAQSSAYETLIFMGHCGPKGLGDRPEDPCGKDWKPVGGDHGDLDLQEAIVQTRALGKAIPLVVFGHMHHQLRQSQTLRTSLVMSEETVYLNAARVPRIIQTEDDRLRNFSLVTLQAGIVSQASLVWLGKAHTIVSEQILFERSSNLSQAS